MTTSDGMPGTRTEVMAGITTFLATMYIIVVNPAILSVTGMPFSSVLTATVLVSAFSSIMMGPVLEIRWRQLDDAILAFLALILVPLTFSITQGILWGLLSWTVIKLATGKKREVSPTLLVIDLFCVTSLFV